MPGVALAVLDTSRSGLIGGRLDRGQLEWLDELAARCATPVLVFGHHPVSVVGDPVLTPTWALDHPSSDGLLEVVGRRRNVCGYFAGHSHRNAVNRFPATGAVPFAEVAAVKDFPGTWAEYRIFEGGILAVHRRISSDREAVSWSERCRDLYAGGYPAYALGALADRCYTVWSATSTS